MTNAKQVLISAVILFFGATQILPPSLIAATLVSDDTTNVDLSNFTESGHGGSDTDSMTDQKAKVFNVEGSVEIRRAGSNQWTNLQESDVINEGDKIRTSTSSSADIYYDEYLLNFVRIEPESEITFTAIEPTRIDLNEGGIFNNLDGLISGTEYEVATPTSVAAVRGTRFMREFDANAFEDNTLVSEGSVDLNPFLEDGHTLDKQNFFKVSANQTVAFDREALTKRDFKQVRAQQFNQAHVNKMQTIQNSTKNRLEKFAGGANKLKAAHHKFETLKKDAPQVAQLRSKMSQRKAEQKASKDRFGEKQFKKNSRYNESDNMKNQRKKSSENSFDKTRKGTTKPLSNNKNDRVNERGVDGVERRKSSEYDRPRGERKIQNPLNKDVKQKRMERTSSRQQPKIHQKSTQKNKEVR